MVFIKWFESKVGRLFEENKSLTSNKFTKTHITSSICEISDRLSREGNKYSQNATDKNNTVKMMYEAMFFWWISLLNSAKQINPNEKNSAIHAYLNWSEPIKIVANNIPDKALVISSFNVYYYKFSSSSKYRFFVLLP